MKRVILLAMLVAAMVVIAACGGGQAPAGGGATATPEAAAPAAGTDTAAPADTDAATGGRHLTISTFPQSPTRIEYGPRFYDIPMQEAFPDDTFEFVHFADFRSLQIPLAAGAGPDLLHLSIGGPSAAIELAKGDRILPMDQWSAQYGWSDIIHEWAYGAGYWQGQLWSIPDTFEGMGIFYNVSILNQMGFSQPPQTYQELMDFVHACVEAGIVPIAFGNADWFGAVDWLYSMFLSNYAGPDALREAIQGTRPWNDPLIRGSLEMMVEWWQNGWITERASQAITMSDATMMVVDGRAAMEWAGSWRGGTLAREMDEGEWVFAPMPGMRPGVDNIVAIATGSAYSINAGASDPDFAAEVLNWMFTTVDRHRQSVVYANWQPYPIQAIDDDFWTGMHPDVAIMNSVMLDAMADNRIGWCAWTFFAVDVRTYMNENTDGLFMGLVSMDEFIDEIQRISDAAVAADEIPPFP